MVVNTPEATTEPVAEQCLGMMIVLAIFTAGMFAEFPEFGRPLMERFADAPSNTYLRTGLEETGAANIVTAVLLDFRAYDTLGEATVFPPELARLPALRRLVQRGIESIEQEGAIGAAARLT